MKPILSIFSLLFFAAVAHAQETVELNMKLTKDITATYHVLKSDMQTKQGLYQVSYGRKKIPLASGMYSKGKKAGMWHFFNEKGELAENFNYDKNELNYEAPEKPGPQAYTYSVDHQINKLDSTSKPIKVGGRFYGYLPFIMAFKLPPHINFYDWAGTAATLRVTLDLLVSPYGRLADYTIHIDDMEDNKVFSVNLNQLSDEDKTFIPAKINGEPVACTISIPCTLTRNGQLTIL